MRIKGCRTLFASGAFFIIGMLSVLGTVDLSPVIALFVQDPAYLGVAMTLIGVFFGMLRYFTDTAAFDNGQGPKQGPGQCAPMKVRARDAGV